ncbi:hypothetical protein ATO13_21766 [Stappia sp. 22II-S9-Z10]|nr:hypothetical protein ATO13_21766 [Stappia sp. 22II-S9-Z10]
MTTFDEALDFAQARADHLDETVRVLMRTRAPMHTATQPRTPLGTLNGPAAAALNADLLSQVPGRRLTDTQSLLVLAAVARHQAVDIVVAAEPQDAARLAALRIGLDGIVAAGTVPHPADGPAVRRARFGIRRDDGTAPRLAAIHLSLGEPGSIGLTHLAVEPVA